MPRTALETDAALSPPDEVLVRMLNAGGVESGLGELQVRYRGRIQRMIERIVRDRHLAEDLTQDVFARVLQKSHLYRPGSRFQAWLFKVARNHALSAVRARRRAPQPMAHLEVAGDAAMDSSPEWLNGEYEDHSLQDRELADLFVDAVDRLPEIYRDVFRLCVQQGIHYQEAASRLRIPLGTVATRIRRARMRLFQELGHHLERIPWPPARGLHEPPPA